MILIFRENDGVTGSRLTLGETPIDDGELLIRDGRHITGIDKVDISDSVDHARLIHLLWSQAGHTIDSDIEFPDDIGTLYGDEGNSKIFYDDNDLVFDSRIVGIGDFVLISSKMI